MKNFLFIIFCFVFVCFGGTVVRSFSISPSTEVNSVRVIKNKPSNLPPVSLKGDVDTGTNLNSYKFLSINFEEKLYAFQPKKEENQKINIIVYESSDRGEQWQEKIKIPCKFSNASCDVMSSIVVDNELILIYGNETEYSIAKCRNSLETEWEILQGTNADLPRGEAIYYSGIPFELDIRDRSPYILCYNLKAFEDRTNSDGTLSTAVAACSFSYTEGKSWEQTYYIYIDKNLEFIKILHAVFLNYDSLSVKVITKSEKSLFLLCAPYENDIYCSGFSPIPKVMNSGSSDDSDDLNSLKNIYGISDKNVYIYKREKAYILTVSFEDQNHLANDILLLRDESLEDVLFHIILTSESTLSIMYEKNTQMHVIYVDLTKKKPGCEFISDGKKLEDIQPSLGLVHYNKNYSGRFLLNSEEVHECYLSSVDIAAYASQKTIRKQTFFKWFSVVVPNNVDFENGDECFVYSFFNNSSNSGSSSGSRSGSESNPNPYATKIIKLYKIVEKQNMDMEKVKEYYFYFPAKFYNYFSDVDRVSCYSTDKKYAIHYTFENNKYLITALIKSSNGAGLIHDSNKLSVLNTDNKYWLKYISEKHEMSSYVMDTNNYLKNYKNSTAITNTGRQLIDQLVSENVNIKKYSIVTFPLFNDIYTFEGVDLTNTSPYYKTRVGDINQDTEISIDINIRSFGTTTVGLVCPLNEEISPPMLCFDSVYDENNNVVQIEEIHKTVPFFVIPKRKIYGEQQLVESLIEYDNFSYQELIKNRTTLSFSCKCQINNYTVIVHYKIKGETEKQPSKEKTQRNPSEGETQNLNSEEITQNLHTEQVTQNLHTEQVTQNLHTERVTQNNSANTSGYASLEINNIKNEDFRNNSFSVRPIFYSCISLFFFMFYSVFI